MAVEQEAKSSIEQRKRTILTYVENRLMDDDRTIVFHPIRKPNPLNLLLKFPRSRLKDVEISVVGNEISAESRFWTERYTQVIKFKMGDEKIQYEEHNEADVVKLEGEEALTKIEETVHEFLPLKITSKP